MRNLRLGRIVRSIGVRFAVVSLIPIAALGYFLDSAVRQAIESRSGDVYAGMTHVMFRMAAGFLVQPEDFTSESGLSPERVANVEGLLSQLGVSDESVRVVFAAPDGRVVFATHGEEVGRAISPNQAFVDAAAGERSAQFTDTPLAGDLDVGRIVEIYLPVTFGEDETVRGVIVASGIDDSIVATIDRDIRRMQISLVIGLGALWLVLLPISASLSKRLRRKSQENEYLALHDTLTGLPNRNLIAGHLRDEINRASRSGSGVGLLLIDLDRFKEVNDTLGHGKGDEFLVAVAQRLQATIRPFDVVARLGGDEFAVVVHDIDDAHALEQVAMRISEGLSGAADVGGVRVAMQASIGGAVYPAQACDEEELLRHADIAMYAAKDSGLQFAMYSSQIDSHSPSRLALAAELLKALEQDEFVLHFQPVASPLTGEVESMEALVRWNHPTRGLIAPSEFIPLAEQSGIIRSLTTKVLDMAVSQAAVWQSEGHGLKVAVNLSANDLRSATLVDEVRAVLVRHDLPAQLLELEVTETALLDAPVTAAGVLERLRALGTKIALDDFGTGYSSLTYLKQLHPDRVKIDRSFVNAMVSDPAAGEIVRSVIELAHSLNIEVTAEGVETAEQWALLATLACDLVQGFYLACPLTAAAASKWLDARTRETVAATHV